MAAMRIVVPATSFVLIEWRENSVPAMRTSASLQSGEPIVGRGWYEPAL
jgi:hypothetical protein